jgi:hypothetical protein
MKKPTFFLSSTIFDFHDLRSALKYYLEEKGCQVLASEFNDFKKPLEPHSYEACLESIESADYFVLLIGARVGGWFDENQKISITQQEYRAAYQLHKAGKLRLLAFVRLDIWNFKDNHKALVKHLKTLALSPELESAVAKFPNKTAEDAAHVISFIEEVGRNKETLAASRGAGELPTANWVHSFNSFRDIADVINAAILSGLPVDEATYRRVLRYEIVEVLRACLLKGKTRATGPRVFIEKFERAFTLTVDDGKSRTIPVPAAAWDNFALGMIHWRNGPLNAPVINNALSSTAFVEFDAVTGGCIETPVFTALRKLDQEIRELNGVLERNALGAVWLNTKPLRFSQDSDTVHVAVTDLILILVLAYRWLNIVELSKAILVHLDGKPFQMPGLKPRSPIQGMNEDLKAEEVTRDDALKYAGLGV